MEASSEAPLCNAGEDCAILFARTPIPGRVKSRLWTHLTREQACQLHCAATSDTAALLAQAFPKTPKWIFFSEGPPPEIVKSGLVLPPGFHCDSQVGNTLGERMAAAFVRAFAAGARRVVIFGSDSPTLPQPIVRQAYEALDRCDLVLGPTGDGGYYLIGCRRFATPLFQGVEWSTSRTREQTLANARRLGYQTVLLECWFDLDEWKDVERLLAAARQGEALPAHLAGFLKSLDTPGN